MSGKSKVMNRQKRSNKHYITKPKISEHHYYVNSYNTQTVINAVK